MMTAERVKAPNVWAVEENGETIEIALPLDDNTEQRALAEARGLKDGPSKEALAAADLARKRDAARAFLAETDWLVIRAAEGVKPMPDEIAAKRDAARKAAE